MPGFQLLLLSLLTVFLAGHVDCSPCEVAVQEWVTKETIAVNKELTLKIPGEFKLQDLLFFLHIPRTGGRTYHQCFLKNLFTPEERCPRSYDKLRLEPSQLSCKLLSTHDDLSILSKLEPGRTSVVTNFRHPLDRVLSMYEFSVEVAARFLRLKSMNTAQSLILRSKSSSQLVSTLNIWPWKYLVPFMRQDIFNRVGWQRDAKLEGHTDWIAPSTNTTYDASTVTMPLLEFVHHSVAHELVHNGATFQVAGLTNNSNVEGANMVRRCVSQNPELGHQVLYVAKRRLDAMLYIGLTEKHQESATMFVSLVGDQVSVQLEALKDTVQQNTSDPERELNCKTVQEKDPLQVLLAAYNSCIDSLQSSHASRRAAALQLIRPVKFSKEERRSIPTAVVDEILSLNSLDVGLYQHAEKLYLKQEQLLLSLTESQVQVGDGLESFGLMLFPICFSGGILAIALSILVRERSRVGSGTPLWLRRLLLMQVLKKQ